MGLREDKSRTADVICQHKRDGTIIPIKIRIEDDDGEFQTYKVRSYKDLTQYTGHDAQNRTNAVSHIWKYECKIAVFGMEKRINLFYYALDNRWKVSFLL